MLLLGLVAARPTPANVAAVARLFRVSRPTARAWRDALLRAGLVEKTGAGFLAIVPAAFDRWRAEQAQLLGDELAFQQHLAASPAGQALPRGPIHADLFRDNVMFDDTAGPDRLCGFFDFYFAGTDCLLFDVAVCLNDWCTDLDTGALEETRATAFMQAYRQQRALTHGEVRALPALLRAAALRFWISRLWDWHLPRSAALLAPKDPTHFERVLRERIDNPWHPPL